MSAVVYPLCAPGAAPFYMTGSPSHTGMTAESACHAWAMTNSPGGWRLESFAGDSCLIYNAGVGFYSRDTVSQTCRTEYPVLQNPSESIWETFGTEEGGLIAGAVLAVWAVGFAFRAAIRALNIDGDSSTSTESEKS